MSRPTPLRMHLRANHLATKRSALTMHPHAQTPDEPAYALADESSPAPASNVYMEPMTLNPNHDSGNAAHYNVAPAPRNSYPLGLNETGKKENGDSYLEIQEEVEDEEFNIRIYF